ncbi:MAG: extracellular solute-binding protein [Ruminococcus sp.]|nr:extracellular solute-binding protein [Ruminococcus sp.]
MKMTKRILAGVCALTLCSGLAACGGKNGKKDGAAQQANMNDDQVARIEAIADSLPDKQLANTEVKWLAHYDFNPGDGQAENPGLHIFQTKYGGSVKYISSTWDNRYTDLAKYVMASDSPDFFPASDMDGFPKGAIKAMFEPIDDYIDLDSDLWSQVKNSNDQFIFNGSHYVAAIKSAPNFVCVYNKKTMEDNGFDDPAELYWNDQWTFSKFSEMCISFTDADADKYGLDGYWYGKALNDTCGTPLIGLENGKLVNNMDKPEIEKVQNLMYDLQKNNVVFDRSSNGWDTRGNGETGNGLGSYLTLFIPVGLWGIENTPENTALFGDVDAGEIMFVPMPRLDDSDTYYVSARIEGYFLCKGAPNPEGFATLMDCLLAADKEASEIGEEQLVEVDHWNDEMIEMRREVYRLVEEHPVYDFEYGVSAELSQNMDTVNQATMITGGDPSTWTSTVQEWKGTIDYLIKEANDNIQTEPTAD